MSDNWTDSNLERFTLHDLNDGELFYRGTANPICKVCNKDILSGCIVIHFPNNILVEGIAHKSCMEKSTNTNVRGEEK